MFKRKFIFVSLALILLLILSACTEKEPSSTTEKEGNGTANNLLTVSGDTVSEQGGCVLASRFTVGDKIVFRMDVKDPSTNEQVEDAKVQVHLSTGEVLDMAYGEHPPGAENAPKFWVAAYPVTAETPTGTLEYHVTAEAGDRKGEFKPFNVQPSLLTIVDAAAVNGQAPAPEAAPTEETKPEETAKVETNQTIDLVAKNFEFNEDEFYVKAGEEVTLNLTSEEGTHGIAIIGLDVTVDQPNGTVKFTPEEPGEYPIACSIFCGAGHGDMTAKLIVI